MRAKESVQTGRRGLPMKILVSACLLGICCRYDGRGNPKEWIQKLAGTEQLIPVCPEQLGGLPTPRPPVEWQEGKALNCEGGDCTEAFLRGAQEALKLARLTGCELAILKARSPSCGSREIYDGTFSGRRIQGQGAAARLLSANGIRVFDETEAEKYLLEGISMAEAVKTAETVRYKSTDEIVDMAETAKAANANESETEGE